MSSIHLPPQAYTRETLALAYEWLKKQPPSIREIAKSADDLVALYKQSLRHRTGSLVQAIDSSAVSLSNETFKSELKHLAEGIKKFEEPSPGNKNPRPLISQSQELCPPENEDVINFFAEPDTRPQTPNLSVSTETPPQIGGVKTHHLSDLNSKSQVFSNMDSKTREMLEIVKVKLNLSHEQEALRMLVVLGFERIQNIFPKDL